jgi:hypothetical protein
MGKSNRYSVNVHGKYGILRSERDSSSTHSPLIFYETVLELNRQIGTCQKIQMN